MATAMSKGDGKRLARKGSQGGFSLIEVMVSMAVLTVGLVSLAGVFGLAMATTQSSQQDMIAKQLANEAYESIITAHNTTQLGWDDLQNVGSPCAAGGNNCGIFLSNAQQIYQAGLDGIYGTQDDVTAGLRQSLHDPGPDGIYGNADDVLIPLTAFQRTIAITNLGTTLRNVTITVQYTTPQSTQKTYVLTLYISEFQ